MGQSAGPGPGPGRGPDPRRPGAARAFAGNHPSATIILEDLSPENVGRLLAFYEARTVYEGFIWGVNSFDQFGVELGKKVADGLRSEMARKNDTPGHDFAGADAISKAYLRLLFDGKYPL